MSKVTIYGLDGCSHCRDAKEYMKKNKINFTFIDLNLPQNKKHLKGLTAVPKICINGDDKCVIGFNEERIKKLLS